MATTKRHDVKDLSLAPEGVQRIEWADRQMPVLGAIRERFAKRAAAGGLPHRRLPARHHRDRQPDAHAQGRRRRRRALRLEPALDPGRRRGRAGRRVRHPDLRDQGRGQRRPTTSTSRRRSTTSRSSRWTTAPTVIGVLHTARREQLGDIIGGTEETTTGVIRLRRWRPTARSRSRSSRSTTPTPSTCSTTATAPASRTIDGIIRATNVLLAGKRFVVAGYGWCGRGVAMRARGHGRARDRHRDRPDARARGGDGRLSR